MQINVYLCLCYDARGQITSMTKKGQSNEQDVTYGAIAAIGTFLVTFCFEIGVYLSKMINVGVDKEAFDRFAQTTIENFGMLLLGLIDGLSLGVKIFHTIASMIKAAIDVDKTFYPEDYY